MAKQKIYLSPSSQSTNPYKTGSTTEDVQCGKIAKACAVCLESAGFEVKVGANTGGSDMYDRVQDSNTWGANLHVPVHTNAGAGKTGGPQVYIESKTNSQLYSLAEKVLNCLKSVTPGSGNIGIYDNIYNFYEIKNAKAPTIYCECEFHDTEEGSNFIINNTNKIGAAIATGICEYYQVAATFPDNMDELVGGYGSGMMAAPDPGVAVFTITREAFPDPAQNITLSTDVTLRNGNFSYSFELPKKEGFGYYYNRATFKNGINKECGYTTFLIINNTEIIQLDDDTQITPHEDSTIRIQSSFVLKDILSNSDLNKLKAADSIQFGVKTYVKKPDNSILYSYVIPHASNSICLRVNNYNIIINPYNKD